MAVIDGVILKGSHTVTPESLQRQALENLHVNHMEIEKKTKLLVCESIYWIGMNMNIENNIKNSLHVLIDSKHSYRKDNSP